MLRWESMRFRITFLFSDPSFLAQFAATLQKGIFRRKEYGAGFPSQPSAMLSLLSPYCLLLLHHTWYHSFSLKRPGCRTSFLLGHLRVEHLSNSPSEQC